jgi:mannitol/fructose-specific phosphotransferase system IIA component
MGNGLAIPHGTEEAKGNVIQSGLSLLQIPDDNTLYIFFFTESNRDFR